MTKWQYATIRLTDRGWTGRDGSLFTPSLDEALNEMGSYGWELVAAPVLEPPVLIFKQPV